MQNNSSQELIILNNFSNNSNNKNNCLFDRVCTLENVSYFNITKNSFNNFNFLIYNSSYYLFQKRKKINMKDLTKIINKQKNKKFLPKYLSNKNLV